MIAENKSNAFTVGGMITMLLSYITLEHVSQVAVLIGTLIGIASALYGLANNRRRYRRNKEIDRRRGRRREERTVS